MSDETEKKVWEAIHGIASAVFSERPDGRFLHEMLFKLLDASLAHELAVRKWPGETDRTLHVRPDGPTSCVVTIVLDKAPQPKRRGKTPP